MAYIESRQVRILQDVDRLGRALIRAYDAQRRGDWRAFIDCMSEVPRWAKAAAREAAYLRDAAGQ